MDIFEGKYIMRVSFSDDSCVHYILESCYICFDATLEDWKLAFKNHLIPDIILSDELISSVVNVEFFSIGNFFEY